jgi:hypothetical protein
MMVVLMMMLVMVVMVVMTAAATRVATPQASMRALMQRCRSDRPSEQLHCMMLLRWLRCCVQQGLHVQHRDVARMDRWPGAAVGSSQNGRPVATTRSDGDLLLSGCASVFGLRLGLSHHPIARKHPSAATTSFVI